MFLNRSWTFEFKYICKAPTGFNYEIYSKITTR